MPLQSSLATRGSGLCLLSLDSGGPRGVSQLTILSQLMHRLNHDSHDDQFNRPCDVFDMIGGVGSGGFIAILLVIFGLTAEKALDEFIDLCVNVLDKGDIDAETRTAALKKYIDGLLERHEINQNTRLLDSRDCPVSCKVAIPISYKQHVGSIFILRNYSVRKEKALNLTIAEALMATLATPPMFTPTQVLKDAATFEYMSADWTLSNPIEEIIAEAHEALGAEQRVACLLSLGCGHPGVFSAPIDSQIVAWNKFLENLVTGSEQKAKGIDSRMGHLGIYHRFSVSSGLERTSTTIPVQSGNTVTHTQVYLDDATVSRNIDACAESLRIRDGISSLEQLQHTGRRATLSPQLPPLTTSFVMRKKPWEFIKKVLLDDNNFDDKDGPRTLIVTGIGGCGKTQLMLKFLKEYRSRFISRIFIDGSSEDRIRADILRHVRSLGTEHSQKSFDDCLIFLSQPLPTGMWLLVYDNVDDPGLDLSSLLPRGDSCAVTITSRNGILGDLHPEGHLRLDIMELEEAVELLLHGYSDQHNTADQARIDATAIAKALGCLPIALQQARAYMRQTKCSARTYLERLSTSRAKLLRQSIKHQLDSRAISTYAAFETSFSRLPESSQKLLWLLSYFHWSEFPLELVVLAARNQFSEYEETIAPHAEDFYIGKSVLEGIFLLNGEWDVTNLDATTLSLQNYSLVSVTSGVDTLLFQMHPLTHEWVHACIAENEGDGYQSAAILLLALGARRDRTTATQYLASHVTHMSSLWKQLSLNDATAFRSILDENGVYQSAMELQELIMETLRQHPDTSDKRIQSGSWELSNLYYKLGRLDEAEALQMDVLKLSKEILGERHPGTISASSNLALTYRNLGRFEEAEALQREGLKLRKEILGERHPDTISVSNNLALTYCDLGRIEEAEALQTDVLELRKEILGERHPDTITASNNLANIYGDLGRFEEAEALQADVLELSKEILGERHPDTISASANLAITYCHLGRFDEAEALQADVLKLRKEIQGDRHPDTISASNNLALTYRDLGRLDEAEALQADVLKLRKEIQGDRHPDTISASNNLALTYCHLGRFDEAEALQADVLKLRKEILGERHPHTINASESLACYYRELGRLNEANALFLEALSLGRETLGEHHPYTINISHDLAISYSESGRLKDAEGLLEQVLSRRRISLGEKSLDTILASSDLAVVFRLQGRLPEAEKLAAEVLQLRLELLGDKHHETHLACYRLAAVYYDQGRFNEAEAQLVSILDSMRNILGINHYKTTATMLLLSKVYRSLNRIDDARELLVAAEPAIFNALGIVHPQYLELQETLSSLPAHGSVSDATVPPHIPETSPTTQTPLTTDPIMGEKGSRNLVVTTESILLMVTLTSLLGFALYMSRRRL